MPSRASTGTCEALQQAVAGFVLTADQRGDTAAEHLPSKGTAVLDHAILRTEQKNCGYRGNPMVHVHHGARMASQRHMAGRRVLLFPLYTAFLLTRAAGSDGTDINAVARCCMARYLYAIHV